MKKRLALLFTTLLSTTMLVGCNGASDPIITGAYATLSIRPTDSDVLELAPLEGVLDDTYYVNTYSNFVITIYPKYRGNNSPTFKGDIAKFEENSFCTPKYIEGEEYSSYSVNFNHTGRVNIRIVVDELWYTVLNVIVQE